MGGGAIGAGAGAGCGGGGAVASATWAMRCCSFSLAASAVTLMSAAERMPRSGAATSGSGEVGPGAAAVGWCRRILWPARRQRRYLRATVASLLADEMLGRFPGSEAFRLEAMRSDGALHFLGCVDGAGILTNVDAGSLRPAPPRRVDHLVVAGRREPRPILVVRDVPAAALLLLDDIERIAHASPERQLRQIDDALAGYLPHRLGIFLLDVLRHDADPLADDMFPTFHIGLIIVGVDRQLGLRVSAKLLDVGLQVAVGRQPGDAPSRLSAAAEDGAEVGAARLLRVRDRLLGLGDVLHLAVPA